MLKKTKKISKMYFKNAIKVNKYILTLKHFIAVPA